MKIGAVIQARVGSSRLPRKIMKKIEGKTVLDHVITRVNQSTRIDEIIVATTLHERDSVIESEALKCGVKVFRGSEEDVLSRYYYAAKQNKLDVIVRITSDCPLIDPVLLDDIIQFYQSNNYDIITNAGNELDKRTYPRGLDIEIFSVEILENAYYNAEEKYQREHVTPYIYEKYRDVYIYKNDIDYSKFRWTLDTAEDLQLITEIYKRLYHGKHDFFMDDIIKLFDSNPELFKINAHVEQKKLEKQE